MPITSLDQVSDTRLCWPENKPRAAERQDRSYRGGFFGTRQRPMTRARALAEIEQELTRMGVREYVVSAVPAYRQGPSDPGAAVWWNHPGSGLRVLACDTYARPHDNLHAIALTLEAMRGLERWGAYTLEQAVEGAHPALPPPEGTSTIHWPAVLGKLPAEVAGEDALAILNSRYRKLAAEAAGDEKEILRLNLAIDAARREFA